MGNQKYKLDLGFFRIAFWVTVILAILKVTGKLDVSLWVVFSPLLIAVGMLLLIILFLGLLTIYLLTVKGVEEPDEVTEESEKEANEENES